MNKTVFENRGLEHNIAPADTINRAGGQAYSLDSEEALARYAVTGTFNDTYYVGCNDQLEEVEKLAGKCSSHFIAQLAVYSREEAKMKDVPAYLLAVLVARNEHELIRRIFHRVCNNSKVLFGFIRIIRSGAVGRKSFGTVTKRLIQDWIRSKPDKSLYLASVGHSNPSMADAIKMVHPKPRDEQQSNMLAYLLDKEYDKDLLPYDIQVFEELKNGEGTKIPDVPFRALTNCDLSKEQWREIALNMPWNTLRQSLVLLGRRGVFGSDAVAEELAQHLGNAEEVRNWNAFPFELLATWKAIRNTQDIPIVISNAIQQAMEHAVSNVPEIKGNTLIAVDVSGSMGSAAITGRSNKPSIVSVVEAASLIACSLLRKNKTSQLIGFDCNHTQYGSCRCHHMRPYDKVSGVYLMDYLNPYDSIMTNVNKMEFPGGGTDCSLPFMYAQQVTRTFDNIILLSDNQSWCSGGAYYGQGAAPNAEWQRYLHKRNPHAKLACVDLQAYLTNQVPDVKTQSINIAGFSDVMFEVLGNFFNKPEEQVDFRQAILNTQI